MSDHFSIEPSTKVAALLDHYPELEEVLIGIAPPFEKLRNPLLRRSVAKVASLRHAAAVGRVPIVDLINTLRDAVGQEAMATEQGGESVCYFESQPEWFDGTRIVESIDERAATDQDEMPLATLLRKAVRLEPSDIIELVTGFLPAPGIDIMKKKGYRVWCVEESPDLVRSYFSKSPKL